MFTFRITMRRGEVTSRTLIPSQTQCTPTAMMTLAPSCLWQVDHSALACMATTQDCGVSLIVSSTHYIQIYTEPISPSLSSFNSIVTSMSSCSFNCRTFAHTWTQEHDLSHSKSHLCVRPHTVLSFLSYFSCPVFLDKNVQIT